MKIIGFKPILLVFCMGILVCWGAVPTSFAQGGPSVDCDAGESLQAKLDVAKPGWVIDVSGTCNERISIDVDRVTLDGGGTWNGDTLENGATIDGTGTTGSLISVRSSQVVIRGFTIQNADVGGISFSRAASATIQTNIIQNNGSNGISLGQGSYARIGGDGFGHNPDSGEGNIIRTNNRGINVRQNGSADIFHNKILSNNRDGIRFNEGGTADVDGNFVSGNGFSGGGDGIELRWTGSARLSGDGNHGEENTITLNNGFGIDCRSNSTVRGVGVQAIGGNTSGLTRFIEGCVAGN